SSAANELRPSASVSAAQTSTLLIRSSAGRFRTCMRVHRTERLFKERTSAGKRNICDLRHPAGTRPRHVAEDGAIPRLDSTPGGAWRRDGIRQIQLPASGISGAGDREEARKSTRGGT